MKNTINNANIEKIKIVNNEKKTFDCTGIDLELMLDNQKLNLEIKAADAQMGEASFQYNRDREVKFIPAKERMDPDISNFIVSEILSKMEPDILSLIDYLRKEEPVWYHEEFISGLPFRVTKRAWTKAVEDGVLKPVNGRTLFDERIIEHHYNKKDVYYIQIEKLGLFYLKENPLNLPVPKLQGDVTIEVRMKRGGSDIVKSIGEKAATAVLRASGRLKFKNKSDYSLDNIDDVKKLFGDYYERSCMDKDVSK